MNLKPTAGYILVEPLEAEKKTPSGIVLPESHEEKPQKGRVLAVGPAETTDSGTKRESPCDENQVIFYKKWGGNEVEIEGKEYLFIKFEDILAIEER
ncbi:co-chaperone GroES [Candidatus Shapirobacteria bacterium]|nr:co-chaperone GroES [Candidatus Shapirobacteria bacterium]